MKRENTEIEYPPFSTLNHYRDTDVSIIDNVTGKQLTPVFMGTFTRDSAKTVIQFEPKL